MASARKEQPNSNGESGAPQTPFPDIGERLLAYFRRNTEAMDSAEGIARFWVREDREVVGQCLADLHQRGFLERRLIGGTAFYSCQGGSPATPIPAPPRPATAQRPEAPGRILVVDDDPSVRKFLVAALIEAGHSVAAAEDGSRGIEIFQADPCELVVTDVMMPGTSGLEVLRAVKRRSPGVEVIVVTAHASLDMAVQALRDGAYDLLSKPLPDLGVLFRVVDRALERRRLSEDNRRLVANLQARNVELTETVARLAAVNEIGKATAGVLDVRDLYGSLVRLVAQHLQARRVSVLVSGPDSDTMTLAASIGIPEGEGTAFSLRVGEGIAGRVAASQTPLLVRDIDKTELQSMRTGAKYSTPSFMITPLTVSYPIRYQAKRVGVINVSDKHSGEPFTEQDLEFVSTLASQMAVAIENARLVKEMEDGYLGALIGVIQAMEELRPETRGHSRRSAELAAAVAQVLGLPEERAGLLVRAVALHEIGRLSAGPEEHERAGGRMQPGGTWCPVAAMASGRLLAPMASLRNVREIILRSADWFDAAPSPIGDEGGGVPIESRILAICEEFVTLCGASDDPQAAARALEAVQKRRGRKHDPEVVSALARVVQGGRR